MSFPDVSGAMWDWTEPLLLYVVTIAAVDGEAIETPVQQIPFDGTIEPMQARELLMKAEGERKFKWFTLWTYQPLSPDNIVGDENGDTYRVVKQYPWKDTGYQQYEIIQTPNPPYAGS